MSNTGDKVSLRAQDSAAEFDLSTVDRVFEVFCSTKNGGVAIGFSANRSMIEGNRDRRSAMVKNGRGGIFSFAISRQYVGMTGVCSLNVIQILATGAPHAARNA